MKKCSRLLSALMIAAVALALLTGSIAAPIIIRPFYYAQIEPLELEQSSGLSREELEEMLDPRAFIGCCPSQVTRFLKDTVQPVVDRWGAKETLTAKLEV